MVILILYLVVCTIIMIIQRCIQLLLNKAHNVTTQGRVTCNGQCIRLPCRRQGLESCDTKATINFKAQPGIAKTEGRATGYGLEGKWHGLTIYSFGLLSSRDVQQTINTTGTWNLMHVGGLRCTHMYRQSGSKRHSKGIIKLKFIKLGTNLDKAAFLLNGSG